MLHFLNPWYLFFDENAMWPQLVCAHFSVTDTGSLHPMAWLTPRGPEVFAQKTRQDKKDAEIFMRVWGTTMRARLGKHSAAPNYTCDCLRQPKTGVLLGAVAPPRSTCQPRTSCIFVQPTMRSRIHFAPAAPVTCWLSDFVGDERSIRWGHEHLSNGWRAKVDTTPGQS